MSIRIEKQTCTGCGQCVKVCPGSLIYRDTDEKAFIKYQEECWGCTACLKACSSLAIHYYLGKDMGGKGGVMTVKKEKALWKWHIKDMTGKVHTIITNTKSSNQY